MKSSVLIKSDPSLLKDTGITGVVLEWMGGKFPPECTGLLVESHGTVRSLKPAVSRQLTHTPSVIAKGSTAAAFQASNLA